MATKRRSSKRRAASPAAHASLSALPSPPLLPHAAAGVDEPMVLSAPPLGRSGDVTVRKPLLDALCADPAAIGAHVLRIKAQFTQGSAGGRSVSLRLDLDEDFPNLPVDALPARLEALQKAGAARCAEVLGADFRVLSVFFGGKKLR